MAENIELTKKQFGILDHTAHRTANGLYCGDSKDMQVLVELGLMHSRGVTGFCPDEYFCMTKAGKVALAGRLYT